MQLPADGCLEAPAQGIHGVAGSIHRGSHRPNRVEQRSIIRVGDLRLKGDPVAASEVGPGNHGSRGGFLSQQAETLGVVHGVDLEPGVETRGHHGRRGHYHDPGSTGERRREMIGGERGQVGQRAVARLIAQSRNDNSPGIQSGLTGIVKSERDQSQRTHYPCDPAQPAPAVNGSCCAGENGCRRAERGQELRGSSEAIRWIGRDRPLHDRLEMGRNLRPEVAHRAR